MDSHFQRQETLSLITPNTRLIILNSPANPCGGVTPRAEIDALVEGLAAHPQVAILSDEIYDRMTYDDETHVTLLGYPSIRDRLILLNGWSKTYAMTGWRLGYSVWPDPSFYEAARKLAVNCWSCVNAPTQFAGLAALTGPQDAVNDMVAEFDRRRRVVVDALNSLPGVSCIVPKGAHSTPSPISPKPAGKRNRWRRPCWKKPAWPPSGGRISAVHGEGYLRISYANSLENIERAIERIDEFLKHQRPGD